MNEVADSRLLGQRLADIRAHAGLSQQEFAIRLGISRSAYQFYERGERELPLSACASLAHTFGVDPMWMMFENGDQRVLEQEARHARNYCKILFHIEERLLKLNRSMTPENKISVAVQFGAEILTSRVDLSRLENQRMIALDNMIYNFSKAA